MIRGFVQIIGRVHADPDYLPRSSDFGLNQHVFREKFCSQCPEPFYRVAFLCCDLNPDKRSVDGLVPIALVLMILLVEIELICAYLLLYQILWYGF